MRSLCDKAPDAARILATTILEFSDINNSSQGGIEGPQQKSTELDNSTIRPTKRKRASSKDLSYQQPNSAKPQAKKAKAEETNSMDKSGQFEDGNKLHIDGSAKDFVVGGIQPPIQDEEGAITQDGNVDMYGVKSSDGVDTSGDDVSWLLDQQQFVAQDDSVGRREKTADNRETSEVTLDKRIKEAIQEAGAASGSNVAEEWRPVSLESATQTASLHQATPETAPATPKQAGDVLPSPQTEEIRRGKIPTSLESVSSSPRSATGSSSAEVTSLRDVILEAVRIVYQFSKYQHGVPREVHSRILQTLREDHKETISVPNLSDWSDGSMWMRVLEAGESEKQKVTIFNMLEYMGAWEWYDRQVKLSQATVRTKNNKLVNRRGAAIHVLNKMQAEQPGRWVKGLGRLTLGEEGNEPAISPKSCDASISEQARSSQRKRINRQLSRGRKLSTKLVKELSLGILFSPKIW
jgi:hypothetical protein